MSLFPKKVEYPFNENVIVGVLPSNSSSSSLIVIAPSQSAKNKFYSLYYCPCLCDMNTIAEN